MEKLKIEDIEFHSLHWKNFDREILRAHKDVMNFLKIEVNYTEEDIPHGEWLDRVIGSSKAKVVAIIEPDLIPLNQKIVEDSANYAYKNDSFLGCAQASNHIYPAAHIFASPAFFFITPSCYEKLGKPSFKPTERSDVAEEISYTAEERGVRYKALFPTFFERQPREGAWPLGAYGFYGIGTLFENSVYHLFQSRFSENKDLFIKRCHEVISGSFTTESLIKCTSFEPPEKICTVKKPKKKKLHKKIIEILIK